MPVSDDRKFTKEQVYSILQDVKGKTLGEVDKSTNFRGLSEAVKSQGLRVM